MKKINCLIALFIISNFTMQLHAQITALPADSAMWVYGVRLYENTTNYVRNLTVKLIGDTLLGGKTYGKIYYAWGHDTAYNSPNNLLHCFIRNDTNFKAYVRYPLSYNGDTSDVLLYDFLQVIGDTFNLPAFQSFNSGGGYCNETYKYVVVGSGYMWDNFLNRNIQTIQYFPTSTSNMPFFGYMAEFHASTDFIFFNELKVFPDCIWENADSIYLSVHKCFWYKGKWRSGPCELYANIEEKQSLEDEITLFPNPMNEKTILSFSMGKYSVFQIIDITGNVVYETSILNGVKDLILEKNHLKSGLYIGRLLGDEMKPQIIKIIIN